MRKKNIIIILLLVQIVVIGIIATYAWFESDFDPVIYSGDLNITVTEGLTVQITEDNDAMEALDVETIVRNIPREVFLSQVSTTNGKDFFKQKVLDDVVRYEPAEKNEDYIEIMFMLVNADDIERDVFINEFDLLFHTGTGTTTNPVNSNGDPIHVFDAIRTAITYSINDTDTTIILANGSSRSAGASNERITALTNGYTLQGAVANEGLSDETPQSIKDNLPSLQFINCLGSQTVHYSNHYYRTGEKLFTLGSLQGVKLTIRIWLEGADPECTLPISGTKVNLNIVLG